MIPVKWYIVIMLGAGACTFLYGLATADIKVVLGSFIFTGMGGLVYYSSAKRR
jgi:hypothetical protein